jgi:MoaA/NifB/PqqE/SkfB family radical SAM enzyme
MTSPATLMLHLTGRCNLECVHCYMEGSPRRRDVLPYDWVSRALRDAPALGVGTVFLTGGEPTLYPQFDAVLAEAAATEGLSVTLCTNATRLKAHHAALFARLGVDVHVSIDGPAAFHDRFRAHPGAFETARRGIAMLTEAGVRVSVTTTVTRDNLPLFDEVARLAVSAGVSRLLVQPLLDLGRAGNLADSRLSPTELARLILMVSDVASRHRDRLKTSIIGGNKRFFLAHPCAAYVCNGGGCHRGVSQEIKKIVVRETGHILPEATNLDPAYAIGHVSEGPLAALVARYFRTGYAAFDRLARTTYRDFVPDWPAAILPWDELLAARSRRPLPETDVPDADHACGSHGTPARAETALPAG